MSKKNDRVKVQDIEKALDQDERIELWISKNWKKCAVGTVVLIAVIVIGFVLYLKHNEEIRNQSIAIAEASPEALPGLLAENPDVPGAGIARIRLAHYLLDEKKDYVGAEGVFNQIAADTTLPESIRNNARMSAINCMVLNGKIQEASEAFIALSNDSTLPMSVKNEAVLQAARLLLILKEKARAEELLQNLAEMEIPEGDEVAGSAQINKMYAQILLVAVRNGDFD